MVDERLTSVVARNALVEAGVPVKRHKGKLDKLAAQTILQAFLDDQLGPSHATQH
jgi:putative Holliday junction resolvase